MPIADRSEARDAPAPSDMNTWLRDGEASRTSGAAKQAHPGGLVSNKADALAAFALRKPDRAPKQVPVADEVFQVLTPAEFDAMVPRQCTRQLVPTM